ncbi:hypothetical protein TNCV_1171191 [Trichonephila clavipes]|nr:hypothetical protein TNCV_1171191 [Trichonephila clavipes]
MLLSNGQCQQDSSTRLDRNNIGHEFAIITVRLPRRNVTSSSPGATEDSPIRRGRCPLNLSRGLMTVSLQLETLQVSSVIPCQLRPTEGQPSDREFVNSIASSEDPTCTGADTHLICRGTNHRFG